jgi:hypothetical protein
MKPRFLLGLFVLPRWRRSSLFSGGSMREKMETRRRIAHPEHKRRFDVACAL